MQADTIPAITFNLHTPVDDDRRVFLMGNFNHWDPNDQRYELEKITSGNYRLSIPKTAVRYPFNYKYHKGHTDQEELDQLGNIPPVRRLKKNVFQTEDVVPRWRHNGLSCDPFYLPQKYIIEDDFRIPQLDKRRRIWALLPYSYSQCNTNYPVLYLQDAQNLFNEKAPFGNWAIDQKMAVLAELGFGDVIIIAIEHGDEDRIKEYSPFDTEKFGAGEGKAYAAFIHDTLKPYVDKKFRTKPHRISTGIGGSSMGGLISVFTGLTYPKTFSKWMVFSPSLWLSSEIFANTRAHENHLPTFVYIYGGKRESKTMEEDLVTFTKILEQKSADNQHLHYKLSIHPTATHHEKHWGAEFPHALKWLFYE